MTANIEWYRSLPRKRSAAAVVLRNHSNEILLVKPVYKDHWQLAGGVVDDLESPRQAALREVVEELALQLHDITLSVIDYVHNETLGDSYQMIFEGGVLSEQQIVDIKLDASELSEYGFFTQEQGEALLSDRSKKRMMQLWSFNEKGCVHYLENGVRVTS